MSDIVLNNEIQSKISRLSPIGLDSISGVRLMDRVEIKYLFTTAKVPDLLHLLSEHYQVLQIRDLRILPYSTTYYDTDEYLFYNQHTRGEYDRHKIRYRKYETTDESFLEIKKRTNKGRTIKWRIENSPGAELFDDKASGFIREYLPISPALIKPVLVNHFTRITLAGYELRERITIDFNISFSIPGKSEEVSIPYLAIAEQKKEAYSESSHFKSLIKQMNLYQTGFSKYCVGSALLNNSLKINNVKPKILFLNKLKNEYTRPYIT